MKIQLRVSYEEAVSIANLLDAWREFLSGKSGKRDVRGFALRGLDNIALLHGDLVSGSYVHSGYQSFKISDPKPRHIHKASVRDRLPHHALYRVLYPFFDRTFIADSYSCRVGKGTHKAMNRFHAMAYVVSRNHTRTCWVLKCDVKKFFASIDHWILKQVLASYIPDSRTLNLLYEVIDSFHINGFGRGLPLGNLTSQLFCNIYMNEFDQFVKHSLKAQHYVRYADDFVVLSHDRLWLENQVLHIAEFLGTKLRLSLHQDKLLIKSFASGVDFLGLVHWPTHRVLRTTTKRRIFQKFAKRKLEFDQGLIDESSFRQSLASYLGVLRHCHGFGLQQLLRRLADTSV